LAFTYDLTTDRGKVRLQLGDTSSASYVFEDAEIDYFIDQGGTVKGAAIEALKVLLASRSHRVKRATVHGLSIDDTAQCAELRATIRELGGAPTISITHPTIGASDYDYTGTG
jgi:hypothetical protein